MKKNNLFSLLFFLQQQNNLELTNQNILNKLPISVYWKDKEGVYLSQNHFAQQIIQAEGFIDSVKSVVINRTDFDLFDTVNAKQFRENDLLVMDKAYKSPGPIVEKALTPDKRILPQISIKQPLLNRKRQIIGVVGCTIPIYQYADFNQTLLNLEGFNSKPVKQIVIDLLAAKTATSLKELVGYLRILATSKPNTALYQQINLLSLREMQSLCLIARGCSAKEISQILDISSRTVEVYVSRIKEKLNLSFKSQLSDWLWQMLATL